MKILIAFLLAAAALTVDAAHVQFNFRDFVGGNIVRRPFTLAPLSTPTGIGTNSVISDTLNTNTVSGMIIVSNVYAGSYRCTVSGPAVTTWTILVPDSTALVSASTLQSASTNSSAFVADVSGNTLWVDAVYGSDQTGTRGREDKPFLTLTNAKAMAQAGDLIWVRPGTFTNNNLMKSNVNWHFDAGAVVSYTDPGTGAGYGIFDDRATGAAGECHVSGAGQFVWRDGNPVNPNALGAVVLTDAATTFAMEFESITVSGRVAGGAYAATAISGICVKDCVLSHFRGRLITDTFEAWPGLDPEFPEDTVLSGAMGVYWQKGEMHLNVDRITMDASYAIWADEPAGSPTANLYITGQFFESLQGICFYVSSSASTNYRVWLTAQELSGVQLGVSVIGPAKVYVMAEKIAAATAVDSSSTLWLTCQKLTCTSVGGKWVNQTARTAHISVQEFEDTGGVSGGITCSGAGTIIVHGGLVKSAANGSGCVNHAAGTMRLNGCIIDGSANNIAANRPVVSAASGLTLKNCTIICGSSADSSIYAASAQTVKLFGSNESNKAKHANVTTQVGTLLVDANVQ